MYEKIWYMDLSDFITYDNYYAILPLEQMTLEEKLNAIVRFFIYLGILLALIKNDYRYLFFGIIACIISIVLYRYQIAQKIQSEKFLEKKQLDIVDNKVCARSTVQNPFMNPSIADISLNPDKPEACNIDNPGIQNAIKRNYDRNFFKDVSDIYDKLASQRQFYTMPVTTIVNDQTDFANWCYKTGPSCKEKNGGEQCYRNQFVVRTH